MHEMCTLTKEYVSGTSELSSMSASSVGIELTFVLVKAPPPGYFFLDNLIRILAEMRPKNTSARRWSVEIGWWTTSARIWSVVSVTKSVEKERPNRSRISCDVKAATDMHLTGRNGAYEMQATIFS